MLLLQVNVTGSLPDKYGNLASSVTSITFFKGNDPTAVPPTVSIVKLITEFTKSGWFRDSGARGLLAPGVEQVGFRVGLKGLRLGAGSTPS